MRTPAAITALVLFPTMAIAQDAMVMPTLVPDDAIIVAEIHNLTDARNAWSLTGPGKLWKTPEMQAYFESISEDAMSSFDETLDGLGLERDDLEWPDGAIGFGVFFVETDDNDMGIKPATLMMAQLGESEAFYRDLLEKIIDQGLEERTIEIDEEEFGGTTIVTVMPQGGGADDFDDNDFGADAMMGGLNPGGGIDSIAGIFEGTRQFHYAIADSTMLLCDDLDGLRSGIEGINGDLDSTFAGQSILADTRRYVGSGNTGFAIFNAGPAIELAKREAERTMQEDQGGMFAEMQQTIMGVLEELGLFNIRSVGMSFGLNAEAGDLDVTAGALLSDFSGIWELIPDDTGAWDPGRTVGRDAISASRSVVRFDQIIPLARRVLNTLPEEMRQEAMPGFQQFEAMGGPILASMRGDVETSQYLDRPLSTTSSRFLVTAGLTDETPLLGTLGMFAPMAGLTPREFEGGQIFANEEGFVPFAVGIGGAQLFIGDARSIEAGLRGGAEGGLAGTERFAEASRNMKRGAFMDSWSRTDETIRSAVWGIKNAEEAARQQLRDAGFTEEDIERMYTGSTTPEWIEQLPDADFMAEYFGDSYTQAFRTPEGIRMHSVMMRPH